MRTHYENYCRGRAFGTLVHYSADGGRTFKLCAEFFGQNDTVPLRWKH